jgi:hypothetical protein
MNLLGTTGTRSIDAWTHVMLEEYLRKPEMDLWLSQFDGFVSGGCRGWDAIYGETLALKYRDKKHVVIVPANRSQVDPWWEKFEIGYVQVVYMDDETDYRRRNEEIVRWSSQLFYCADYPEDHGKSRRSGTWMTVRIAKDAGMTPHGIIINDGATT